MNMALSIFYTTVGTYLGTRWERRRARTAESPSRKIDHTGLPEAQAEQDALASIEAAYAGIAAIADVYAGISPVVRKISHLKRPMSRIALCPAPTPSFDELARMRYVMSRSRIGQLMVS